jgi:hypothetical protein
VPGHERAAQGGERGGVLLVGDDQGLRAQAKAKGILR